LNDDFFTSAPQLKRDPLGGGAMLHCRAIYPAVAILVSIPGTLRQQSLIRSGDVCGHQGLFVDSCFTIHRRMQAANGIGLEIWVVGTHKLLGVTGPCALPPLLDRLIGIEDKLVYADFVVRPLTPERPGSMRMVCVASATKVVTRPAYFIHPPPH
jgi:hypothetical protein